MGHPTLGTCPSICLSRLKRLPEACKTLKTPGRKLWPRAIRNEQSIIIDLPPTSCHKHRVSNNRLWISKKNTVVIMTANAFWSKGSHSTAPIPPQSPDILMPASVPITLACLLRRLGPCATAFERASSFPRPPGFLLR